ncbi:MAG TPA: class I SAM-dependent methyltransferase [Ferruginibacter sp.]|nr:class I SAM-dependent methyltransferase [Ferruginibacter sp.]HRO05708.1 class I SAM-dependent methyltransferase [Ferruginibacter sp.]HRP49112.1 class I SAM-dependent methyltransferase [Ferruginibacter sp.]
MEQEWINRWDERYSRESFAYGEQPNEYLKRQLVHFTPGTILFPAEGEGRNAVYAAGVGWEVSAFDISTEGQKKAMQLAQKYNVAIDYRVGTLDNLPYTMEQFDAIALIYAHFPPAIKESYHQAFHRYLKKGGVIIFEAFSKTHLEYIPRNEKVGGPKDLDSLFSIEEINHYFPGFEIRELVETEIELAEGVFHNGTGSVIRFVGVKQ